MKDGIHPEYREVVFQDMSNGFRFITRSTLNTREKITLDDGKEYPLFKLDVIIPAGADGIRCDEDGNVWAGMGWVGDGYDGVHVFAGLHDDTLLQVDGLQFVGDVLVELGVAVPVPSTGSMLSVTPSALRTRLPSLMRWAT